jgi:pyruvate dehydrogenase E1 component alpha subunit
MLMFDQNNLRYEMVQILDENGNVNVETLKEFPDHLLVEMYQWVRKSRIVDERLLKMQRQGRIGTYAPFSGQEAAQIGSVLALEKDDWIFPSYREIAACLAHGMPLTQIFHYVKGHILGGRTPEDVNIFPIQIIIGAQTLHATGCAWATKLKGEKQVSVCYFGDGATSEGDFHEALNFASVYKLPVIFFCQNNQYAISVPVHKQTASRTIAQKALAYGMKGILVDGNDCLAVYKTMKEAVNLARNGEGPVLIEALTYRLGPHTTSDDPTKYRNEGEVDEWKLRKDPINRLRTLLLQLGLWSELQEEEFTQQVNDEITQAYKEAEEIEASTLVEAFDYVYDQPTKWLEEQKQEVIRRKQMKEVK